MIFEDLGFNIVPNGVLYLRYLERYERVTMIGKGKQNQPTRTFPTITVPAKRTRAKRQGVRMKAGILTENSDF